MKLNLTGQEAAELFCCYVKGCRGNNPRKVLESLDKKMFDMSDILESEGIIK